MKCWKCGEEVTDSSFYCNICGARLSLAAEKTQSFDSIKISEGESGDPSKTQVLGVESDNLAATQALDALSDLSKTVDFSSARHARGVNKTTSAPSSSITAFMPAVTDAANRGKHYRPEATVEGDSNAAAPEGLVEAPFDEVMRADTTGLDTPSAVFAIHGESNPSSGNEKGDEGRARAKHGFSQGGSSPVQEEDGEDGEEASGGKHRKVAIILVVAACVVALIAGMMGYRIWQQRDQVVHGAIGVPVSVQASAYASVSGLGIPLHITGTDLEGNAVSQDIMISPAGETILLKQGTYVLTGAGDIIDGQGRYFVRVDYVTNVVVDESGYTVTFGPSDPSTAGPMLTFSEVSSVDITDQQIQSVSDWMKTYGFDDAFIESVVSIARVNRDTRKSEIEQASEKEKEKKKAEEQAALQAQQQEIQQAYDENPSSAETGSRITITGKIKRVYQSAAETRNNWEGVWYILELTKPLSLGRQSVLQLQIAHGYIGAQAEDYGKGYVYLEEWEPYLDKVVTLTGTVKETGMGLHDYAEFCLADPSVDRSFS